MDIYRILGRELARLQECVLEVIWIREFSINHKSIWHSFQGKSLYNNNEYIVTCHLTFVSKNLKTILSKSNSWYTAMPCDCIQAGKCHFIECFYWMCSNAGGSCSYAALYPADHCGRLQTSISCTGRNLMSLNWVTKLATPLVHLFISIFCDSFCSSTGSSAVACVLLVRIGYNTVGE